MVIRSGALNVYLGMWGKLWTGSGESTVVCFGPHRVGPHLLALEDGVRKSTQNWLAVLVDLQAHSINPLPNKAALTRCWLHKTDNVLKVRLKNAPSRPGMPR